MTAENITIYHNPGCGTSRSVLALIREAGIEPTIVEYLKSPPDRPTLEGLLSQMRLTPRQLLRQKEPLFEELGLSDPTLSDAQLIGAMLENPRLMNRPVVVSARGARLCRPPDTVHDLLPKESHE